LIGLPDAPPVVKNAFRGVTILLGNASANVPDSLLSGRESVRDAIELGYDFVPARVAFVPSVPRRNPLPVFIRAMRMKYIFNGSGVYHTDALALRRMGIERGRRTRANAYGVPRSRKCPPEVGAARYDALRASISRGWDDACPIEIMLLRQMGSRDNLVNGHHRLSASVEEGVSRVTVRFSAAGSANSFLRPLLRPVARFFLWAKLHDL
jgi:hypothetical protein